MGYYRLMTYGGTLSGDGLILGQTPNVCRLWRRRIRRHGPIYRAKNAEAGMRALEDMQDAADDTPVIDATYSGLVFRQMRLQCRPSFVRQPFDNQK